MTPVRKTLNCRVDSMVSEVYIWYCLLNEECRSALLRVCSAVVHSVDSSQFKMNFVWNSITCMNASPLKAARLCQRANLTGSRMSTDLRSRCVRRCRHRPHQHGSSGICFSSGSSSTWYLSGHSENHSESLVMVTATYRCFL